MLLLCLWASHSWSCLMLDSTAVVWVDLHHQFHTDSLKLLLLKVSFSLNCANVDFSVLSFVSESLKKSFIKLWKLWDFYFTSSFYQFSESMTLNKLLFTKLCFLNCSYVYNYGKEHSCHNLHHVRMMWVNRAAQNIRHSMKRRSCGGAVWSGDNNTLYMRLANMISEVSSKWSADLSFVVELDFMSMN